MNPAPDDPRSDAFAPAPAQASAIVQRAVAHVAALSAGPPLDPALRVTLNFHPDRLFQGQPILAAMAATGTYRSQFETATSNGGLTAYPGGDRWKWESRIFDGAYDAAPPAERPKYGGLNHRLRGVGAAPRFGSAHVRMSAHTLARTTFCFPDSVYEPQHFGVAARMGLIPLADSAAGDPLDDYIEAHVHGPVSLASDVEALVLDPCYRGTEVEHLARALPCPLEWHAGFRLSAEALQQHSNYRGAEYVALGCTLVRAGWLTPDLLGVAARSGQYDQQALKRVWHYLARFGQVEV